MVGLLAQLASLPPSGRDIPITVNIDVDAVGETWTRNFAGHRMRTRLWQEGDFLAERLGPITLRFALSVRNGSIEWRVAGARFFGVPLRAVWFVTASASENVIQGRYAFAVEAGLPLVGLLIRYQGWLIEA